MLERNVKSLAGAHDVAQKKSLLAHSLTRTNRGGQSRKTILMMTRLFYFLTILIGAITTVSSHALLSVDAHAHSSLPTHEGHTHDDHGSRESDNDGITRCPLCSMSVKDYNMSWFLELNNGQRIYTCGMNDGTKYESGTFSHPSLLGATMVRWQLLS